MKYRVTVIIDGITYQSTYTREQIETELPAWFADPKATTFLIVQEKA